jgi:hypothetical protein
VSTGPSITFTLDPATIEDWAQLIVTALQNPVAILFGIGVGGAIIMKVRGLI